MKKAIIVMVIIATASLCVAAELSEKMQVWAANTILDLTKKWMLSPEYPTHDEASGLGQMVCVKYIGSTNNAPARLTGVIVSRIITDKSMVIGGGEKWCLVEFGDGPPWGSYPLTNLVSMPVSQALKDFPEAGMKTVRLMLGE